MSVRVHGYPCQASIFWGQLWGQLLNLGQLPPKVAPNASDRHRNSPRFSRPQDPKIDLWPATTIETPIIPGWGFFSCTPGWLPHPVGAPDTFAVFVGGLPASSAVGTRLQSKKRRRFPGGIMAQCRGGAGCSDSRGSDDQPRPATAVGRGH